MTLEEKAAFCTGATTWTTTPVERLGIPALFVSDGPHGVRKATEIGGLSTASLPATCFPTASATACTWDPALLTHMGEALDARAFSYWHPGHGQWVAEEGAFEILVGASSADIRLRAQVTLRSTQARPSLLHRESTVRDWLRDGRGRQVLEPQFETIRRQMGEAFGSADAGSETIGMDMTGFLMEMPLLSLLQFSEGALPMPAEAVVDAMLAQVRSQEPEPVR